MPELPEVERAAAIARAVVAGRRIASVRLLHPALRRRASRAALASLVGASVVRLTRRGKHQLLELDDGRTIHVHFRMAGDWAAGAAGDQPLPPHARAVIELADGGCLVLVDPRALSTFTVHDRGASALPALGPEPSDPALDAAALAAALARRRGAIKPVLLDQRLIAGVGNIYAGEALWRARIDPRTPASGLGRRELGRLLAALRRVLEAAGRAEPPARAAAGPMRFAVYDREGLPCRRCGRPIARLVQAGRSTYFCPRCQRARRSRGR